MRHPRISAIVLAGVVAIGVGVGGKAQTKGLHEFFDSFAAEWVRSNPDQATVLRYFTGAEQRALERQLTPQTRAWGLAHIALAKRGLSELARFDRSTMSREDRLYADVMAWQLQIVADSERFWDYDFPFQQFNGVNVGFVSLLTIARPLSTADEADNYLAALGQLGIRLDEALADARAIAQKGLLPPRFVITATVQQMKAFASVPASENPLVTVIGQKLPANVPDEEKRRFQSAAENLVSTSVYPAWQRAIVFLESLQPRTGEDAGLWRLEGGREAYNFDLKRYTTTTLTADQIHAIGLKQVAQIESQMESILKSMGRTSGSLKERVEALKKEQSYPLTEDGRTALMADANAILHDAETRAASMFDHRPQSPVRAQPFPRFLEANTQANYLAPAQDGSRPGIIQIPLRPERMTKFALKTLVYHEGVPGHHFQIALQTENRSLPRFMQLRVFGGISAFSEGWGLYAERLAADAKWYEGDPIGRLGQLDGELWRARRLVVDTGLHAKRWTRQQGIDYGIEAAEVERYVVYPGQACSYMLGQLKLIEMRDKAQAALGNRFSMKDYHNMVLGLGTVPLAVLESRVNDYIRENGGR